MNSSCLEELFGVALAGVIAAMAVLRLFAQTLASIDAERWAT